jgi:Zn-dependent protease with chaperone function
MTEHDPPPGDASDPGVIPGPEDGDSTARKVLEGISSRSWEHPADRAALHGLRGIPVFDEVLRKLFGIFGERPIRLAFQANAVEVSPRQFPRVHGLYLEVLGTLDAPEVYPLFVSQTPMVNAGAYGMERPFILLNSGTVRLLDDDELQYVLAHEVGHVLSGHVLYRTMMAILLQLAARGFPIVGLAARGVLVALLEWYRRSELSSDRAGLLGVQDPDVVFRAMMKMAGGGTSQETEVSEFISQAEAYRESDDLADSVFKVLNILGSTHPFYVLRVSELRSWIETGAYDRILRGEYPRRGDPAPGYAEEMGDAAKAYETEFREFVDDVASAARKMRDSILESLREGPDRPRSGW